MICFISTILILASLALFAWSAVILTGEFIVTRVAHVYGAQIDVWN